MDKFITYKNDNGKFDSFRIVLGKPGALSRNRHSHHQHFGLQILYKKGISDVRIDYGRIKSFFESALGKRITLMRKCGSYSMEALRGYIMGGH
jgi:hypothetical protein